MRARRRGRGHVTPAVMGRAVRCWDVPGPFMRLLILLVTTFINNLQELALPIAGAYLSAKTSRRLSSPDKEATINVPAGSRPPTSELNRSFDKIEISGIKLPKRRQIRSNNTLIMVKLA